MKTRAAMFAGVAVVGLFSAGAEPPPAPAKAPAVAPKPGKQDGARVDLRPKFEVGQVVRYSMKQTSDQVVPNAEDPKDPLRTRLEQTVGLKMTTKSIDKETGEATVELVYESVKAKLDSPVATVDFDSTRPAPAKPAGPRGAAPASEDPLDAIDNMVTDQFKKMVGTTMTMKIARDGRISSVTGGESLSPTLVPGAAQVWGDAMKQFGGLFGPISTNSTPGFDGTARVGDRWTHRDSVSVGPLGDLDMQTTYDLRSSTQGAAKVFFTGRVENKTSGGSPLVGVENAEHSGQYTWDTRLGQLSRCEMEQRVTLSGTLTNGKPSTATTAVVIERVAKK